MTESMTIRMWHIPNLGVEPFIVNTQTADMAGKLAASIALFDLYLEQINVRGSEFMNASGIEMQEDGEWNEWYEDEDDYIESDEVIDKHLERIANQEGNLKVLIHVDNDCDPFEVVVEDEQEAIVQMITLNSYLKYINSGNGVIKREFLQQYHDGKWNNAFEYIFVMKTVKEIEGVE